MARRIATLWVVLAALAWDAVTPGATGMEPVYGELFGGSTDLSGFIGQDPSRLTYIDFPPDQRLDGPAGDGDQDTGGVLIGVIDSGVNPAHPQLAGSIVEARAFVGTNPNDTLGHGTSVAISALGPRPGRLLSARVTDDKHRPVLDAVIAAVDWMAERRAMLVNMSLGFRSDAPGVERLCERLRYWDEQDGGPLFIVAAGNLGDAPSPVPAACTAERLMVVASDEATSGRGDIVSSRPNSADYDLYLFRNAQSALSAGDRAAAAEGVAELVRRAEAKPTALRYFFVGVLYNELSALDQALQAFRRQAELDPSDPMPHYNEAAIQFQRSNNPAAREAVDRALALGPGVPDALWLSALLYANENRRAAATAALEQLAAVAPDHPHATSLGHLLADDSLAPREILRRYFQGQRQ